MEDVPSDDVEDNSKQFGNKQSDERKYMDKGLRLTWSAFDTNSYIKERNIGTFTPSGRISTGKLEKAKDLPDAFDPSMIIQNILFSCQFQILRRCRDKFAESSLRRNGEGDGENCSSYGDCNK